jgi:putative transposase
MQRKHHSSALKAKIVIEALRETKTVAELAAEHQVHPNLITKWKLAALQRMPTLFERAQQQSDKEEAQEKKIAELYQEIGKLTTQVNWLKKKSGLEPDTL